MAGGNGSRLHLASGESKALVDVAGRPLVDYILEDLADHGVREVAFATAPADSELAAFIERERRFVKVGTATPSGSGTLGAVLDLITLLGDRDHLISTCDVLAPRAAISRILAKATEEEQAGRHPLMVLAASSYVNDDQPIWIHTKDGSIVRDMGKRLEPTNLVFGNVRWVSRRLRGHLENLPLDGVSRDSEFMAFVARSNPGSVLAVDVGTVIDVDTPQDLAIAREMVRAIRI